MATDGWLEPKARSMAAALRRRAAALVVVGLVLRAAGGSDADPLRGELAIHDPSTIVKCDDRYWVFGTGRGILSRSSTNLLDWQAGPSVFSTLPAWTTHGFAEHRGRFWAPDLIHHDGRYLLYYSVSSWGSRNSAIGLAVTPTLTPGARGFGWEDGGMVIRSTDRDDHNAIDPSVLRDRSGRLWLAFGSFWSGIKLVELDPATGLRLEPEARPIALAWKEAIEAPCLFQHEDYYYLFVNWGFCCRGTNSTYNLRVGRSRQVDGPYLDREGTELLRGGGSLVLDSSGRRIGPGHAGVVPQAAPSRLSYHYYDRDRRGMATLGLGELRWDKEGWPEVVPRGP